MGTMDPEICTKMLRKLKAKFPATALSYCMVKIARHFELEASQQKVNHCLKKIRRGEKGKKKNLKKPKQPKDVGHFLVKKRLEILNSAHARVKMSENAVLVERKACYHVGNAFISRLVLICLQAEISKMSKNALLEKSSRSQ